MLVSIFEKVLLELWGHLGNIIYCTCCKYISDVSKYLDLQDENVHTLINDAKK